MNRQPYFSNGGNPFGNFNPVTTNTMNNNGYNYNNSFASNAQIIEKTDFKNKKNFMHNNVSDTLFADSIMEYQLWIDSVDRSYDTYPNPFKFVTLFGGSGAQTINKKVLFKNTQTGNQTVANEKIYFDGTSSPVIDRKFKNMKYIKLDHVLLPRTNVVNIDQSFNAEPSHNPLHNLDRYRYLIVKIKELSSEFTYSTNSIIGNDSFVIYKDCCCGQSTDMWCPESSASKIYLNSNLGNLDRLTLTIMDPKGNVLAVTDQHGNPIKSDCGILQQMDSLNCLYSFLVGIYENEMNTAIKYEK